MKKNLFAFFAVFMFLSSTAFSHPAQDIIFVFNKETKEATIEIKHDTKMPKLHYINKIKIDINGKLYKEEKFKSQSSKESQIYKITLSSVQPNDTIRIHTYCSINGHIEKDFTIE